MFIGRICKRRSVDRAALVSGLFGAFLGTLISVMVAAVMLEISDNRFFAVYFGILFLIIGLAIAKRVTLSAAWTQGGRVSRALLGFFSFVVLFASVSCFILDHNALKLSPGARIPFFIMLGMAVSFAVSFALVDVINFLVSTVHSANQVFLILGASVSTGGLFGLIFGILDVEDDPSTSRGILRDERWCAPIGLVVGMITGIYSHHLRGIGNDVVEAPYNPRAVDDGL